MTCESCGVWLVGPFVLDASEREVCSACSTPPVVCCTLCDAPITASDALPFPNPTPGTVAHVICVARLQRSIGYQQASALARRGRA